jgi:hypothetical protein
VAPGGVYIGGGPVYVIPAPSNGPYVEPTYGYGYGLPGPAPYLEPVVALDAGYVVAAPYGLNGNGYGYGYGNGYGNGYGYGYGYGYNPPPTYYNGDPVLSAYGRATLSSPAPRPAAVIPYNTKQKAAGKARHRAGLDR